jgi:hypothetical protein
MATAPDRTHGENQMHREDKPRESKSSAGSAPHLATKSPANQNTQSETKYLDAVKSWT